MAHAVDMVVLPELYFKHQGHDAELSDGPLAQKQRSTCASNACALAFGYEEACSGDVFNAMQVINTDGGAIANYRCTHPRVIDHGASSKVGTSFSHGVGRWLTIAPLFGHRLAILLGDDLLAPEIWRSLSLSEATCILWTGHAHANTDWVLRTRAMENGIKVVGMDRSGLHAFDKSGKAIECQSKDDCWIVDMGNVDVSGPPLYRQPILYRRLSAENG